MTFTASVQRRWADLDAQGHVNNSTIVDYLQEARTQFMRGTVAEPLLSAGVIVVEQRVQYQAPVFFANEPVRVHLGLTEVGAARFVIGYQVQAESGICATAQTVLCPFDFETQAPRRLSDLERDFFKQHLLENAESLPAVPAVELNGRGLDYPISVRWSDLDQYGHVNNVQFYEYIQEARVSVMTQLDPTAARAGTLLVGMATPADEEPVQDPLEWLVARQDVSYLKQIAGRGEPYVVRTANTKIGNTSLQFTAEIIDPLAGDTVHARAATVVVCANPEGRPIPVPQRIRDSLAEMSI